MKRVLFTVLLIASPVWAGTLCTTTTATEDAQIADVATRDSLTAQQEADNAVHAMIASKHDGAIASAVGNALVNAWPTLTAGKKSTICTQLSVSPCPP